MSIRLKIAPLKRLKNKKIDWRLPLIAGCLALVIGAAYALHVTLNVSGSMKEGLYIGAGHTIHRGDVVAVCLNKQTAEVGLKRGYVLPGTTCESGSAPLIKQVLAMPGDHLVLSNTTIAVNGQTYPYATLPLDSQGRPLASIPRGDYPHLNGYFLVGTNAPNSWDSRYFGPVNKNQIRYRLVPVWTDG